jgi:CO/xanthine dehydrogenase FAD-binding subunit
MPQLTEYHKPGDVPTALDLLRREAPRTVPLAGGTWLNPRLGREVEAEAVVDLSALGLAGIDRDVDTLRLGAMTTLAEVVADDSCRSLADGILSAAARRDATVNVRNMATIGGTLVVAPVDSEFVLALVALGAEIIVQRAAGDGHRLQAARGFLAEPDRLAALDHGLITRVLIHIPLHVAGGMARVARTPADHPIVAAVAVIAEDADAVRVALGGVTRHPLPIELDPALRRHPGLVDKGRNAVAAAIDAAELGADFRGSAEYRREMGILLAGRALASAVAGCQWC